MFLEQQLGIKISSFIAGLMGGSVSLTYEHHIPPAKALLMILAGGLTAGYAFAGAETYWGLAHSYSGVFGFGVGLIAMRIIDTLMNFSSQFAKDPSIVLSWVKIIQALKGNGTNNNVNNGNPVSNKPDMDSPGTANQTDNEQVP